MHELYELKEMLCKELEEYGRKGDLSAGSLEIVDKLAHAVKNLGKIIEMYEEEDEEYSMAGGSYRGGSYEGGGGGGQTGGGSYRGGQGGGGSRNSYARGGCRGRGSNAKRDSMGRYSSRGGEGRMRYSREGGYSRADEMEDMVESIRSMMGELPQEVQQDAQRFVQKLEEQMM